MRQFFEDLYGEFTDASKQWNQTLDDHTSKQYLDAVQQYESTTTGIFSSIKTYSARIHVTSLYEFATESALRRNGRAVRTSSTGVSFSLYVGADNESFVPTISDVESDFNNGVAANRLNYTSFIVSRTAKSRTTPAPTSAPTTSTTVPTPETTTTTTISPTTVSTPSKTTTTPPATTLPTAAATTSRTALTSTAVNPMTTEESSTTTPAFPEKTTTPGAKTLGTTAKTISGTTRRSSALPETTTSPAETLLTTATTTPMITQTSTVAGPLTTLESSAVTSALPRTATMSAAKTLLTTTSTIPRTIRTSTATEAQTTAVSSTRTPALPETTTSPANTLLTTTTTVQISTPTSKTTEWLTTKSKATTPQTTSTTIPRTTPTPATTKLPTAESVSTTTAVLSTTETLPTATTAKPEPSSFADLANESITAGNASDVAKTLNELIDNTTSGHCHLSPKNVSDASDVVRKIASVYNVLFEEAVNLTFVAIDKLIKQDKSTFDAAKHDYNVGFKLLEAFDLITQNVYLETGSSITPSYDSFAVFIHQRQCNYNHEKDGIEVINGSAFESTDGSLGGGVTAFLRMELPSCGKEARLGNSTGAEDHIRYSFRYMSNLALFRQSQPIDEKCLRNKTAANPRSLDAYTVNVSASYIQNVEFGFIHEKVDALHQEWGCYYYYPSNESETASFWKQDGLGTRKVGETAVYCTSTHLTNFAILVDIQQKDAMVCSKPLEILSDVVLIISVISLASLITLLLAARSWRPSTYSELFLARIVATTRNVYFASSRATKPLQLVILLSNQFLFMTLFLILTNQSGRSDAICRASAALLFWLCLSSFAFAGQRTIFLYLKYGTAFWIKPRFVFSISAIATSGLTAVITGALYAVNSSWFWRGDHVCWVNRALVKHAIIPVSTVMLAGNLGFVILTVFPLARSVLAYNESRSRVDVGRLLRGTAYITLAMLVVLEIPWVLQYFAMISVGTTVFDYLFVLANGLQGVWLLLLTLWPVLCAQRREQKGRPAIVSDGRLTRSASVYSPTMLNSEKLRFSRSCLLRKGIRRRHRSADGLFSSGKQSVNGRRNSDSDSVFV